MACPQTGTDMIANSPLVSVLCVQAYGGADRRRGPDKPGWMLRGSSNSVFGHGTKHLAEVEVSGGRAREDVGCLRAHGAWAMAHGTW